MELRCRQQGAFGNQARSGGVAALARGRTTSLHNSNRSQESGIYPHCQGSQPPSGQMGIILYQVPLRHNVSAWLTEHEGGRSVTNS
ncbi:Cardiac-enriched FHL2-interacting protein [Labeo rohita]|uniref:Cardiac-enriched FHL2-interacting protein n=1 Tax=Labeo rohita TaxID=84645 RepID=A0ABQ8L9T2_LABRO|nr:Cardiac-enriched FHL2-interacting protein [Labeo rohita]